MAGALLKRLVNPTAAITSGTLIYTATSTSLVRSIECTSYSGVASRICWINLNDTVSAAAPGSSSFFVATSTTSTEVFTWRGGLVLNPGDTLFLDTTAASSFTVIVNGAINLPAS